jgi:hypothetical protein
MGSKSKSRRQASATNHRRALQRKKEATVLSRQWRREGARLAAAFAVIEGLLGLLSLSWIANIAFAALGMLAYTVIRYQPVSVLLRPLQSLGLPTLTVYLLSAIVLAIGVGLISFKTGNKLGETQGIRKALSALNLPVRPLPPPPPRFPGHVDVDAFCRSEGPYHAVAADEYGIAITWETVGWLSIPYQSKKNKIEHSAKASI